MKITIGVTPMVATASQEKIDALKERIVRLNGKLKVRKERAKAAKLKAQPALKALNKLQKAGSKVPAAVKAAAKAAQRLIDVKESPVLKTEARIELLQSRIDKLKAAGKTKKVVKPAVKAPAKKATVEKKSKTSSVKVKPIAGAVRRPGATVEPAKKIKKVKEETSPVKQKVKPAAEPKAEAPVKKVAPAAAPEADGPAAITPEDRAMQKKIGNPALFKAASKSKTAQLEYLRKTWDVANDKLFGGKLKRPTLTMLKKVAPNAFRRRGVYYPVQNRLSISPNLFGVDEGFAVTTIAHEMAHQAVYELDGANRRVRQPENGHGPEWRRHMVKIGLTPARFSKYSNLEMMQGDDKKKELERRENFKTAVTEGQVMPRYKMKPGTYAMMLDKRPNNQYARLPGVIIDASGTRNVRMFINGSGKRHGLMVVPPSIIMEPTNIEAAEMNRQKSTYDDLLKYGSAKNDRIDEARKQRRDSKKRARSMFGGFF